MSSPTAIGLPTSAHMTVKYRQLRPVVAMDDDGQVLTIPTGETVVVSFSNNVVGLCAFSWNGRSLNAFREDIHRNGIALAGESLWWVN